MAGLLDDALQEGAAGFSSGLMYAPGSGASPEELVVLCRVVARRGGVDALPHMRSYSDKLVEAVEEQISIAEASGCRLQILHLQAAGPDNWQFAATRVGIDRGGIQARRRCGVRMHIRLAGCTVLTQVLPQTALDGGISQAACKTRRSGTARSHPAGHQSRSAVEQGCNYVGSKGRSVVGR